MATRADLPDVCENDELPIPAAMEMPRPAPAPVIPPVPPPIIPKSYGWPQRIPGDWMGLAAPDLWAQLHQCENLTPQWLDAFTALLSDGGCNCRNNFRAYRKDHPELDGQWANGAHNNVNAIRGVPVWTQEQSNARWRAPGWDTFERVYVVSLASQHDRLSKFYREFPRDWPYRRPWTFSAVDGNTIPRPAHFAGPDGALGLHASYLKILDDVMSAGVSGPILLMEDDCAFSTDYRAPMQNLLANAPADWDILFLGGQHEASTQHFSDGIVRATRTGRTHCFAVHPRFFSHLRALWTSHLQHVDWTLRSVANDHRFYAVDPWIAYQSPGYSTLMSRHEPARAWDDRTRTRPPPTAEICSHAGDVGDLIFGMPAMRALGAKTLVLHPADYTSKKITREIVANLHRLLLYQDYIKDVRYSDEPEGFDLNGWRATQYRWHQNIADRHLNLVERPHSEREKPWISVPRNRIAPVVISRSSWLDADVRPWHRLNQLMPWKAVVEKYAGRSVFVGLRAEWELFCKTFGDIPFHETADYLELARVIAGGELFIGNQSSPMSLAIAMGKPIVQEVHPDSGWQNCLFDRPNAVYMHTGNESLPEPQIYFSQHGEDKWIVENLELPDKGVFVEVGAAEGLQGSNTLYFQNRGWTGLLVEPDPRSAIKLEMNRAGPVVIDNRVVAQAAGEIEFTLAPWPEHSGLRRTEGEKYRWRRRGWIR